MQYAPFGSVSSGTMRTDDLLIALADELDWQCQRNAKILDHEQREQYLTLEQDARACFNEVGEIEDSEEANDILSELFDALNTFAPPYAYFGARPGDGADFGYWLPEVFGGAFDGFDGLRVDDTSEVPADYSGEVLHVNDHGNMTLYVADKGELTEVWSLV